LPEGARLVTDTPHVADSLSEGVRLLEAGALHRGRDDALTGRVRLTFFRPGTQSTPAFALTYRTASGAGIDTLGSDALRIDVVRVLPDLNVVPMRDIKDLDTLPGASRFPAWLVAVFVSLGVLIYVAGRAWRRSMVGTLASDSGSGWPAPALAPHELAMAVLADIERAGWAARGDVERHYAAVADVLRRYLEDAHGVRALRRTTPEILRSLSGVAAADGRREECYALLREADLVKFARLRPGTEAAGVFLVRARSLIDAWDESARAAMAAGGDGGDESAEMADATG
ncbi:MAG TPA: hypothetical protein VIP79_00590, partial [Gemmatimonadaceae bacterium]